MIVALILLSAFVVLPGIVAIFVPSKLISLISSLKLGQNRYWAVGIRLAIGASLLFATAGSKDPETLTFFGYLFVGSGVLTLIFGEELFGKLVAWFESWPPIMVRVWGVVAISFGVWLISLL